MPQVQSSGLWPGVPLALGSAALFGASAPLSKLFLTSIDPQLLAGVLYLGAGVGLSFVHLRFVVSADTTEAPLRLADMPWLAATIVAGGVLGPLLLLLGLARVPAASASLLLNLEAIATMTIAWIVFRENVDGRVFLGAAAIVAGAALLSWEGQGASLG